MSTQVWQNIFGLRYAVKVDGRDQIVEALGPLHASDVVHVFRGHWEADEDDTTYVRNNAAQFRDVTMALTLRV